MLNQVILVGRLAKELELKESENGKKYLNITLAVPRSFRNADGEYETDFIDCISFGSVAETTSEWVKKGDTIGIRGRIQTNNNEMQIITEKVTFLSSKSNEINKEVNNE